MEYVFFFVAAHSSQAYNVPPVVGQEATGCFSQRVSTGIPRTDPMRCLRFSTQRGRMLVLMWVGRFHKTEGTELRYIRELFGFTKAFCWTSFKYVCCCFFLKGL